MAKGQMKSNKEVRKPKKEKVKASVTPTPGSAVKEIKGTPIKNPGKK